MNRQTLLTIIIIFAIVLAGIVIYTQTRPIKQSPVSATDTQPSTAQENTEKTPAATTPAEASQTSSDITVPISDASSRITKKSYGTYVTPKNSPVSPEIFTGYHTGVDFETFPNEKDSDVVIKTICDGKLLRKTTASGYGGYAVQSCVIKEKDVTVVYGHLRLTSIAATVGDELKTGDKLGVLGTGYSSETSNERKHLHLSIHIGTSINIKGYTQAKSALSEWMDPQTVLDLKK